jgi:hypothetical protein
MKPTDIHSKKFLRPLVLLHFALEVGSDSISRWTKQDVCGASCICVDGHNTEANAQVVLFKELLAVHSIIFCNSAMERMELTQKFIHFSDNDEKTNFRALQNFSKFT